MVISRRERLFHESVREPEGKSLIFHIRREKKAVMYQWMWRRPRQGRTVPRAQEMFG